MYRVIACMRRQVTMSCAELAITSLTGTKTPYTWLHTASEITSEKSFKDWDHRELGG